ncbi:MAG: Orotidine 5'-phosphate decarboxylase, partial [uncultured Sphingomonas sp.]
EPCLRCDRHHRRPPGGSDRARHPRARRRSEAWPRVLLRQRGRGRAPHLRRRTAALPRLEVPRHPQHSRQGGCLHRPSQSGSADGARRGRTRDDGRGQGCGAEAYQGGRGDGAHQPRPAGLVRHRRVRIGRGAGEAACRACPRGRHRRHRLLRRGSRRRPRRMAGRLFRRPRRPARRGGRWRPEASRHAPRSSVRRRLDPRHWPADHRIAGPGAGSAGDRSDPAATNEEKRM